MAPNRVKNVVSVPPWIDNPMLVLSGYATPDSYRERLPSWQPEGTFRSLQDAEIASKQWLATQGAEAQVEVIRILEPEAKVIEVVTQTGIESIDS